MIIQILPTGIFISWSGHKHWTTSLLLIFHNKYHPWEKILYFSNIFCLCLKVIQLYKLCVQVKVFSHTFSRSWCASVMNIHLIHHWLSFLVKTVITHNENEKQLFLIHCKWNVFFHLNEYFNTKQKQNKKFQIKRSLKASVQTRQSTFTDIV